VRMFQFQAEVGQMVAPPLAALLTQDVPDRRVHALNIVVNHR
jgi:hypothetical protein